MSKKNKKPATAPSWMTTFADMMSLLMCFFVLLLANAQTDIIKFKLVAGSMLKPSGPAIQAEAAPGNQKSSHEKAFAEPPRPSEWEGQVQQIHETLAPDVLEGTLEIEGGAETITLRIKEKASFPSGSATVVATFTPLIKRIGKVLGKVPGRVAVAGHTDNRPIKSRRFRSNWELASSRAVTVAHHLLKLTKLDPARLEVRGYGDAVPLVPNDTVKNRSINRRVEIILTRLDTEADKDKSTASPSVVSVISEKAS